MVKKATILAFFAVLFLFLLLNDDVMVINIGIVPKGLIKVKKDVKTNMAKV